MRGGAKRGEAGASGFILRIVTRLLVIFAAFFFNPSTPRHLTPPRFRVLFCLLPFFLAPLSLPPPPPLSPPPSLPLTLPQLMIFQMQFLSTLRLLEANITTPFMNFIDSLKWMNLHFDVDISFFSCDEEVRTKKSLLQPWL